VVESVGNDHALAGGAELRAFGIADHNTNHVSSRLRIEIQLHADARFVERGERGVF